MSTSRRGLDGKLPPLTPCNHNIKLLEVLCATMLNAGETKEAVLACNLMGKQHENSHVQISFSRDE